MMARPCASSPSAGIASPAALGLLLALVGGCEGDRLVHLRPGATDAEGDQDGADPGDTDEDDDDHDTGKNDKDNKDDDDRDDDHDHARPAPPEADDLSSLRQIPLQQAREGLDLTAPGAPPTAVTPAPIAQAYCQINVNGVNHPTETDYIPHVVQCENGGANLEALKAQAIAARSVAYYAMAENGTICDGQGCQVYSCNANPLPIHYQAAQETAGQYLSFNNTIKGRVLTYAFYVAGDKNQTANCKGVDINAGTEKFVTYNEAQTWTGVKETTLGFQFKDPNAYGYGQNRGCMSQWSARCLENNKGFNATKILRYFYGDDIEIQQAEGPCVDKPNQEPTGTLDAAACDGVRGWAHDADVGAPAIDVTVSFGGPIAEPMATKIKRPAALTRDDLCDLLGSCDHGFDLEVPRSLMDGVARPVHAYGHDDDGDAPVELAESPRELLCPPPPLPEGVLRPVDAPGIDAWSFDLFWQQAIVDDATLATREVWKPIPEAPQLIQAEGAPEVYLVDLGFRRWIPSPAIAAAWGFDLGTVTIWPPDMIASLPQGPDVRDAVFLVRGDDPAIYLVDDLFCPEDGGVDDPLCAPIVETTGGSATDGSATDGESVSTSATASGGTGSSGGSQGTGGSESESEGSGDPSGEGSATSGPIPGLPPGYGMSEDEGCACTSGQVPRAPLGIILVAGLLRRRRSAHSR